MDTMQKTLFGLPNYPETIENYIEIRKRYKNLYDIVKNMDENNLSQHMQKVREKSLYRYFSIETSKVPENFDIGELIILYTYFYGGICNFASIIDSYENHKNGEEV